VLIDAGQVVVYQRSAVHSIGVDWLGSGTLRIVMGARAPTQLAVRGTLRAALISRCRGSHDV